MWVDHKKKNRTVFQPPHSALLFYSWGLFSHHPTAGTSECHWKFVTVKSSGRPFPVLWGLGSHRGLWVSALPSSFRDISVLQEAMGCSWSLDVTSTILLPVMAIMFTFSDGVWIYKSPDTGRTCGSGWFLCWAKSPAYTGWISAASRILEVRDNWSWGFTADAKSVCVWVLYWR